MNYKYLVLILLSATILSSCAKENMYSEGAGGDMGDPKPYEFYKNEDAEIIFKHSKNVEEGVFNNNGLKLLFSTTPIDDLEGLMGFDEATARRNRNYLKDSFFGEEVDMPLVESKSLRKLKNLNAQEFIVMSRFDSCDVRLEKYLYFFSGKQQVLLGLALDPQLLKNEFNEYFVSDQKDCEDDLRWADGMPEKFYNEIILGENNDVIKKWLDEFELLAGSVESFDVDRGVDEQSYTIEGEWISLDDQRSRIRFTSQEKIDIYDGEIIKENNYDYLTDSQTGIDQIIVHDGEAVFNYSIIELDDDTLKLMSLPRGNILEYKKYVPEDEGSEIIDN